MAAWALAIAGVSGVLRRIRLADRGYLGVTPAQWTAAAQDLAVGCVGAGLVGLALPRIPWAAGLAGGALAFFLYGAVCWADYLLFLRIGVRMQPRGFAGTGDLSNIWTSMVELGGRALLEGFAAMALGGLVLAAATVTPLGTLGFEAALMGVAAVPLALIGALGPRHPAADHVLALLFGEWTAVRLVPVGPPGAEPVLDLDGEHTADRTPEAPQWRRTLGFVGPERVEVNRGGRPHVLVVLLESFAAQHTGACGASWGATPQLDRWAGQGLFFPHAYGNGIQTVRAIAAACTGFPPRMSVQPLTADPSPPRLRTVAQILGEAGWHTAFWHNGDADFHGQGPFLTRSGIAETRDQTDMAHTGAPAFGSWGLHDEALYADARARLAALHAEGRPTFALMLTLSHHHPWKAPPTWTRRRFPGASPPLEDWLNTLAYADACLGRFLDDLQADGLLDHTVVVLVGDHGSPTGADGLTFDSLFHLAEHGLRVPMAWIAPGRLGAGRVESPVSQVDILPTLLDLLGVEGTHHALGRSLLREGPDRPVLLSNPFGGGWLGLREGSLKVVWRPDRPQPTLHDVVADPEEQTDLAAARPEVARAMAERCLALHRGVAALYAHDRLVPEP